MMSVVLSLKTIWYGQCSASGQSPGQSGRVHLRAVPSQPRKAVPVNAGSSLFRDGSRSIVMSDEVMAGTDGDNEREFGYDTLTLTKCISVRF